MLLVGKRVRQFAQSVSLAAIACSAVVAHAELPEQVILIKQLGKIVGRDQTYMKGAGRRDLVGYLSPTGDDCKAEMVTERVAGAGPKLLGYEIDFRHIKLYDHLNSDALTLPASSGRGLVASDGTTRSVLEFEIPGQGVDAYEIASRLVEICHP